MRGGYFMRDASTEVGAATLAETITAYWAKRGRAVKTVVFEWQPGYWAVRSDLVVASGVWRASR